MKGRIFRIPRIIVCVRIALAATLLCASLTGSAVQEDEYQLKAAFLVNFLKFIEWPDTSGPYVIEVAGKNPFGSPLESLAHNGVINGRKIVFRSEKHSGNSLPSIIFVPSSESSRFAEFLQYAKKPVVVIGESPGFAKKFGAVNFIHDHDRVAFEINPKIAKASGVKVSSRLLQLARIVE